ncbi:hypothetical protein BDK51DRAFT_39608 [Blyttiomyces helicus]|uniref:Uncharacterized protein n=1 Tax=Blyttiomyces helicus TaxID=388810 RepID=A0A4P9WTD1_9FUNG|nr:hypothetical protein BDK51DRAFT_39608 [Blyttiomyces helicus]|eukprot:RKO94316.1 hypothetical protein BDK51DRAFT_39608 [Blyttiomyces helicus]
MGADSTPPPATILPPQTQPPTEIFSPLAGEKATSNSSGGSLIAVVPVVDEEDPEHQQLRAFLQRVADHRKEAEMLSRRRVDGVERVLKRARTSKLSNQIRTRLSLAMLKVRNNWTDKTFPEIKAICALDPSTLSRLSPPATARAPTPTMQMQAFSPARACVSSPARAPYATPVASPRVGPAPQRMLQPPFACGMILTPVASPVYGSHDSMDSAPHHPPGAGIGAEEGARLLMQMLGSA